MVERRYPKQLLMLTGIVVACILVVALIFAGYWFHWVWTGFNKTLWDWMQLLIIPVALALVAVWFNRIERKNEQFIASDNQREAALQGYLDRMSELLLKEKLRLSNPDDEVRNVARVRTLTVLCQLDAKRNEYVLTFLHESGLIKNNPDRSIINLNDADLSKVNLSRNNLSGANLSRVNLNGADLSGTNLNGANLSRAKLNKANLNGASLVEADLNGASLVEADLSRALLEKTNLSGASLRKAKLIGAILRKVNFSRANLIEADLSSALLEKVNLRGANLTGTKIITDTLPLNGRSILWVDDNPKNNVHEEQLFRKLGARVVLTSSTEEALKSLDRNTYDLIISDVHRVENGISNSYAGYKLLDELKYRKIQSPFVFYTGNITHVNTELSKTVRGIVDTPITLTSLVLDVLQLAE